MTSSLRGRATLTLLGTALLPALCGVLLTPGAAHAVDGTTPVLVNPADTANPNDVCDGSHHSDTGHGANQSGPTNPYQNTCEPPHEPGNGSENGAAVGQPIAGGVGNADDKYPPGQATGGDDHNAGYECDRNEGVGQEDPAHTGCAPTPTPSATPSPTVSPSVSVSPSPSVSVSPSLLPSAQPTASTSVTPIPEPTMTPSVPPVGGGGGGLPPVVCGTAPMTTDVNGDGVVNAADCVLVGGGSGLPPVVCGTAPMTTDVNHDGVVNAADCVASPPTVTAQEPSGVDATDDEPAEITDEGRADDDVAEVLGVRITRPRPVLTAAAANPAAGAVLGTRQDLARTGAPTVGLVALATLLILAGAGSVALSGCTRFRPG
ncbi:MAG TPA: dockerin type I repeat-containing protein [Mycobacteriales bacterium]|nr:dockerin type I repeat-containing protein [Mycobacteriales bacterium]